MNNEKETTRKERLSYYSFFMGQNMIYMLVNVFAMLFFTDYMGISSAVVGVIFLLARVWDAINDPLFGIIVDKSNPKKGKYKSWTNMASVALPILIVLMFLNPDIGSTAKIIYVAVIYILWGMAYTVSDVPIFSLSTSMTNNMSERNTMLSISRLFPIISGLLISMTVIGLTNAIGWTGGAILIAVISFVLMTFMRFHVKERHVAPDTGVTVKKLISYIASNKYLLIYYGSYILYTICNTSSSITNYYAIYVLKNSNYIAILSMFSTIPMVIVALFLASKLVRHFGKYKVTVSVCILTILVQLTYFMVGYQNIYVVFAFSFINGLLTGFQAVMYPMFTTDCIEYGTWKTGERGTAISFSIQTFTIKLGQAVAGAVVGILLTAVGYVANVEQSESTMRGIFMMVTLVPALGALLMLIVFGLFYKLRESDVEKYIQENEKNAVSS